MIAAIGRRGELGRGGELVFRLKADMANFRTLTRGKPLVMGRKTWDSFPKRPLPGRPNLVVTRNLDFLAPGAFVYSSIPPAVAAGRAMAAKMGAGEVCVIGGAEIYAAALPIADRLWLTEVDAEVEADVFFPAFDRKAWREASSVHFPAGDGNDHPFVIRELVRAS
jgi:dihydrofolate reductase